MPESHDHVLAIDVGSTWCKAAFIDRTGAFAAVAKTWIRDERPFGHDGAALDRIWQGMVETVREASGALDQPRPAVVAVTARKAPGIWLDEGGRAVGIPRQFAAGAGRGEIDTCYASPIWGEDDPFAYGYGIDLIGNTRWLRRNRPEAFARVRRAGNLHSWLLFRLTGEWATSHAGGPVADSWPPAVNELARLPPGAFPSVRDDYQILSRIAPEAAAELGLPESTPVATGTHDGAAANIGAGALAPGDACLTFGTNGVIRIVTGERIPGKFGYTVTGGRWALVRDLPDLALLLDGIVSAVTGHDGAVTPGVHDELSAMAARVPAGSRGLRLALFPGSEGTSLEDARSQYGDPAVIYRAALEAIGLGFAGLDRYARQSGAIPRRYSATGGATSNELLVRITSACLGAPITVTGGEPGLSGLAALAGVAAGWFPDLNAAARSIVPAGSTIQAADEETAAYARIVAASVLPDGTAPGDGIARDG